MFHLVHTQSFILSSDSKHYFGKKTGIFSKKYENETLYNPLIDNEQWLSKNLPAIKYGISDKFFKTA